MSVKITYENVGVTYTNQLSPVEAIQNFSLNIDHGDFVGIIGESGCGKSTILKLAAGLIEPSTGTVKIDDNPISGIDQRIGYVFQGQSLLPWLSVFDNVAIGYKIRKEKIDIAKVASSIDLVGLKGFEDSKPAALSGGMAQRVSIARALVNDPELLLLDEPFSALDAITKSELHKETKSIIANLGVTVILVTHDFDEVLRLANKVVLLSPRPGRIFKKYENNKANEISLMKLRNTITRDIFSARKISNKRAIGSN